MRPGWNPLRRNRNIGTAKQGHGKDNKLVIPDSWRDSRTFWEHVTSYCVVTRTVNDRNMQFIVEPTRADAVYACTVDDIATMLRSVPAEHINGNDNIPGIRGVILRQPKRKEEILSPVWGRLGYAVDVGPLFGPAIVLEAISIPFTVKWSKHLGPTALDELQKLQTEADESEFDGRRHILRFGLDAVRRVQLYRTVLHEVGHWVDYLESVEIPGDGPDCEAWPGLRKRYDRKPRVDREAFANRYAESLIRDLRASGMVPFERIVSKDQLDADGLAHSDFLPE